MARRLTYRPDQLAMLLGLNPDPEYIRQINQKITTTCSKFCHEMLDHDVLPIVMDECLDNCEDWADTIPYQAINSVGIEIFKFFSLDFHPVSEDPMDGITSNSSQDNWEAGSKFSHRLLGRDMDYKSWMIQNGGTAFGSVMRTLDRAIEKLPYDPICRDTPIKCSPTSNFIAKMNELLIL